MLEAEFADRYTKSDPDYAQIVQTAAPPPIIHPWYNHDRRQFDLTDHGRRRHGHDDRRRDGKYQREPRNYQDGRRHWDDRQHNRHHPYQRYR